MTSDVQDVPGEWCLLLLHSPESQTDSLPEPGSIPFLLIRAFSLLLDPARDTVEHTAHADSIALASLADDGC